MFVTIGSDLDNAVGLSAFECISDLVMIERLMNLYLFE